MSHGESFVALLQHRFGGDGLYILDEPEAALSPQRQLAHAFQNLVMLHPHLLVQALGQMFHHRKKFLDDVPGCQAPGRALSGFGPR